MQAPSNLLIPEGINYECTGCGICCSGWAVPMTPTDYERIANVDWSKKLDKFLGLTLYRPLKKYEAANTPYTMAMNPGPDDYCPFLVDKLCFIHKENGSEFKPSMCQLFPYCFNETPSGIYVTVSFVSMAVVYNSGKALSEQREWLEKKFGDFCKLYPNHHPNWSQLKLTTGVPLDWDTYLSLEAHLINCLNDRSKSLEERFIAGSNHLLKYMERRQSSPAQENTARVSGTAAEEVPLVGSSKLNHIDHTLLSNLHKLYFPARKHIRGEHNFSVARFVIEATAGSSKFSVPGKSFNLQELP
jgi:Fe-S-cluster containining protein